MNRFDLEDKITDMNTWLESSIESLIYAIGDCEKRPSDDDLLNMLIGIQSTLKYKYHDTWSCFEYLVQKDIIKGCDE